MSADDHSPRERQLAGLNPPGTPTAPDLPVNPDRDYCERCGAAGDLRRVTHNGEAYDVCAECEGVLERRRARRGRGNR